MTTTIVTGVGSIVSAGGDNAGSTIVYNVAADPSNYGNTIDLTVNSFGVGDSIVINASDFPPGSIPSNADFTDGSFRITEFTPGGGFDGIAIAVNETADAMKDGYTVTTVGGNIVLTALCFYPGTNVHTPSGDVAVETLKSGDLVTLSDGRTAPISWLGRQTVSTKFADPMRVLPVRIKANALGESVPARDLLISPDHAILVDDILVQAGALVNGVSVVRETNVPETFTYYHVEVADHSLVLAENLAAETFLDNVDRMGFDNWDEHVALGADTITEMEYPRARSARQVPAGIRARLLARGQALYGADIAVAA